MKRSIVLLILFFQFSFFAEGQVTFQKGYFQNSLIYSVQQTTDSGYIAAGSVDDGTLHDSILLIKTDIYGDTLWTKVFGNQDYIVASNVFQTHDGGYLLTCFKTNSNFCLVRTNSFGDTLWTKMYGGFVNAAKETSDGGFVLFGSANIMGAGNSYAFLIKTDAYGDILWTKSFGNFDNIGYGPALQIYGSGYIMSANMDTNFCLIRTDSLGDILWTRCYSKLQSWMIKKTSDSGVTLLGGTTLAKVDSIGDLVWLKEYSGLNVMCRDFDVTSDGGYIIDGFRTDSLGTQIGFMMKTDSVGDMLWCKNYGSTSEALLSISKTHDGGFICGGAVAMNPFYSGLIKTDANGHTDCGESPDNFIISSPTIHARYPAITISNAPIITGNPALQVYSGGPIITLCSSVSIPETQSLSAFTLSPNPTSTTLTISTSQFQIISSDIFNMLGEKVVCILSSLAKTEIELNVSTLSSGIYFVKVETPNGTSVQKLIKQ